MTLPASPADPRPRDWRQSWRRLASSTTQKVITLTGIGMAFALLFDMLTAARFGTGATADALVVAMGLPNLVDTVLREATKFSLISVFVERRASLDTAGFDQFASGLLNSSMLFGIVLCILLELAAGPVMRLLGPGLNADATAQAVVLFRLLALVIAVAPGVSVLSVLFNSRKDFILVALRNASQPVPVVIALVVFWRFASAARWAAAAYSVGYIWFFVTLFAGARRLQFHYHWRALASRADLSRVWHASNRPTAGFAIRQSTRVLERSVASLLGPGAVAAYYFPFRLFSAGQSLIGTSVATIAFPHMAELDLRGEPSRIMKVLRRNVGVAVLLSGPPAVLGMLFSRPLVRLLYGHGSFHGASIDLSARCFFWLAAGLVLFTLSPVLQGALYAQRRYNDVFANMVFVSIVNVLLIWWGAKLWGVTGIAIAGTLAALISTIALLAVIRWRFGSAPVSEAPAA